MTDARVRRGRATQELIAEWLRHHGFPKARAVAASLKGKDVLETPELHIEAKATSQADLTGALRQAQKGKADDELAVVVYRPNGYGPDRQGDWLFVVSFRDGVQLLADAGYGEGMRTR